MNARRSLRCRSSFGGMPKGLAMTSSPCWVTLRLRLTAARPIPLPGMTGSPASATSRLDAHFGSRRTRSSLTASGVRAEHSRSPASWLADVGRQVLIGRFELVEPRLGVVALAPGDVCGEILDVDLESRSVGPEEV